VRHASPSRSTFGISSCCSKAQPATGPVSIENIAFVDPRNALVPIDLVLALPGRPDDRAWEAAYADMIEQARKHGWIDAEANAIRAHVEREQ
jgi:hypothetical protein